MLSGRPVGEDRSEDEVAEYLILEFGADSAAVDPAAVHSLSEDKLTQSFPLVEELVLQRGSRDTSKITARMVVECWQACSQTSSASRRSPRSVPVSGGMATWRVPSVKADSTNSPFDGQRRYTVALLARAVAATAAHVNRS